MGGIQSCHECIYQKENECFIELSMDAKLLYAFFLDRVSLSIKNGWIDNQGRVFIYYLIKNICEDLNCGTQKACKLLDELEKELIRNIKMQIWLMKLPGRILRF